jgi:DNA-directed RNA polymerase subunit RPC12/RpoP
MRHYIFDREKDTLMRDEDGIKISFKYNDEIWNYLRNECKFSQKWIDSNFFILQSVGIIEPEHAVSDIECDVCSHKWVAVFPVNTEKLECPNCNHFTSIN